MKTRGSFKIRLFWIMGAGIVRCVLIRKNQNNTNADIHIQKLQEWCKENTVIAQKEKDEEARQDAMDEAVIKKINQCMCPITHTLMRDPVICAGIDECEIYTNIDFLFLLIYIT